MEKRKRACLCIAADVVVRGTCLAGIPECTEGRGIHWEDAIAANPTLLVCLVGLAAKAGVFCSSAGVYGRNTPSSRELFGPGVLARARALRVL
jgi:hypothetical protein